MAREMFELNTTLGRLNHSDYEMLNIRATLAATSDDERSSSSTCFSTPRSAEIQINTAMHKFARGHEHYTHQNVQTSAQVCRLPPVS